MFSRNVVLNSRGTCGVYALCGGRKNSAGAATGSPFQRISPPSLGSRPRTARSSVVLPDPICPVITVKEPRATREAHVTHAAVAAGVEAGQVANVQEDGLVTLNGLSLRWAVRQRRISLHVREIASD